MAPHQNAHSHNYDTSWAVLGMKNGQRHILNSLHLDADPQEKHEQHLYKKYVQMRDEVRFEKISTDDADVVLVSYGITSRICKLAVKTAREDGMRIGLFRPITLNPFPYSQLSILASHGKKLLAVELNGGQMVEDVMLAANGATRV